MNPAVSLLRCLGAAVLLLLGMSQASAHEMQVRWTSLFDGASLDGWRIEGGKATYEAKDGMIIGTAVPNSPNTFLVTETEFDDFVLELDIRVENELNSGIMFRAAVDRAYRDGKVYGYQMEAEGSDRRWSGGIYEEAMRGWLYPVTRNPACAASYRKGEWNTYRIEAIGRHIQTFVNGVPCARLIDDGRKSGFVGLQVHGVGGGGRLGAPGDRAFWRNIRLAEVTGGARLTALSAEVTEHNTIANTVSDWEREQGFSLLFDGQGTDGWHGTSSSNFPQSGWRVADGMLSAVPPSDQTEGFAEDIITAASYADFELELEFRFAEGANSGVKYFLDPKLLAKEGKGIGLEYQILDDKAHPDANKGVAGKRRLASLYDLIRADNLSEPFTNDKRVNGPGAWNHLRIVAQGSKVEHWLNHIKVVEYDRFSQGFAALVEYSKYAGFENFGRHERSPILLQHHGGGVDFRSIKIRDLAPK